MCSRCVSMVGAGAEEEGGSCFSVSFDWDVPSLGIIPMVGTIGVTTAYRTTYNPIVIPYSVAVFRSWDSHILASSCYANCSLLIFWASTSSYMGVFFHDSDLVLLTCPLVVFNWGLPATFPFFLSFEVLGWILKLNHCIILSTIFLVTILMSTFSYSDHLIGESGFWSTPISL